MRCRTFNTGGTGSIPPWGTKIPHRCNVAKKKKKKTAELKKNKAKNWITGFFPRPLEAALLDMGPENLHVN